MANSPVSALHLIDDQALLGLLVQKYGIRRFEKDYVFGPHEHNWVEINYMRKGSCIMQFGNEYVRFSQNECMIIYPLSSHFFHVDNHLGCTLMQLEFNLDNFKELDPSFEKARQYKSIKEHITNDYQYIKIINNTRISQVMERIVDELDQKKEQHDLLIKLYFSELFILITRHINELFKATELSDNLHVKLALHITNQHYLDPKLSIHSIAEQCEVSERYLRRVFLENVGINLKDYQTSLRINKAKEMLLSPLISTAGIGYEVGYSSPQYFNRMFKKQTGLTPVEYRNMLQKLK